MWYIVMKTTYHMKTIYHMKSHEEYIPQRQRIYKLWYSQASVVALIMEIKDLGTFKKG